MNAHAQSCEQLSHLLACYFHQDWPEEFLSREDVVRALLKVEPAESVRAAVAELDDLLARELMEDDWRELLIHVLGCYVEPSSFWLGCFAWMAQLRQSLASASNVKTNP